MKKCMWCYAVVTAAVLAFSNLASAGPIVGEFLVGAEGSYIEDGSDILIDSVVVEQDPDFGWEDLTAQFEVDEFEETFAGVFTLTSPDGNFTATAAGGAFSEEAFIGLAGVFEITSGTGIFDGINGGGVISALGVGDEVGSIVIRLGGVLIPAPAAFAMFGAAGLVTRRRRRA